jgi:carboxymethylenebutenolidase
MQTYKRTVMALLAALTLILPFSVFGQGLVTETVTYDRAQGVQGYLALPQGEGPFPGLILIHEWWGLNDNIRENAEAFARQGYAALAVDLYRGQSAATPDEARVLAGGVSKDLDSAFANLEAAVSYLQGRPEISGERLASVGWCFGGGWSYQMAKNDLGVRASVMYYGRFSAADDLSRMRALILGNFGEEDRSISVDSVREFQATLKTLSGDHEVYIYPNAGHAFANADSRSYNREAAELAWSRTLTFLEKQLR